MQINPGPEILLASEWPSLTKPCQKTKTRKADVSVPRIMQELRRRTGWDREGQRRTEGGWGWAEDKEIEEPSFYGFCLESVLVRFAYL